MGYTHVPYTRTAFDQDMIKSTAPMILRTKYTGNMDVIDRLNAQLDALQPVNEPGTKIYAPRLPDSDGVDEAVDRPREGSALAALEAQAKPHTGLNQEEALRIGLKNNYDTKAAVVMDFSDCSGGLTSEEALRIGNQNNFNAKPPVLMDFSDCTGGLSTQEALRVGNQNNYNTQEAVMMEFPSFTQSGLTSEEALRIGNQNNFNAKPPVFMDFSDCTGGLSTQEALRVGNQNNYNTQKAVMMEFPSFTQDQGAQPYQKYLRKNQ